MGVIAVNKISMLGEQLVASDANSFPLLHRQNGPNQCLGFGVGIGLASRSVCR
jgi:hypothetical protein